MSIRAMNWVWEHSTAAGNELLLLLAIADNADDNGANAWPSVRTLARKTRLDERTVQRVIGRLTAGGLLTVSKGAGHGCNLYALVIHSPQGGGDLPPRQSATGGGAAVPPGGWHQPPPERPYVSSPPIPPSGGHRCPRHKRPRTGCGDCAGGRSEAARHPSSRTLAEALADAMPAPYRCQQCGDPAPEGNDMCGRCENATAALTLAIFRESMAEEFGE